MWPFKTRDRSEATQKTGALSGAPADKLEQGLAQPRRWSLTLLLTLALLSIVVVGFVAPAWDAYVLLVARPDAFGFAAVAGGVIAALLFVMLAMRELRSLLRLRRIDRLRQLSGKLQRRDGSLDDDARAKAAARLLRGVVGLYRGHSRAGVNLAPLLALRRTKIETAEPVLAAIQSHALAPLDEEALRIVRYTSLRVGAFTAASPWGVLDALIVAGMNLLMVRRILQHYRARPGILATVRMSFGYAVGIGVSSGMGALTSTFAEQASNRIGAYLLGGLAKGTVNATSTALLGLFAIGAVRPIPFEAKEAPSIIDMVFPKGGFVAKTIEKAGQLKDGALGAVQGLLPNGVGQGPAAGR